MKAWFGFAAIAGIGFGIGFFAGERYGRKNERKRREAFDEETSKMKAVDKKETTENHAYFEAAVNDKFVHTYNPDEIDVDAQAKEMDEYMARFESPEEEEEEESKKPEVSSPPSDYIHIVNEDVWDENTEYDPNELRYFDEDEVVVDESDERVEDPEDRIGYTVLPIFHERPEIDEQFVINDWTMEIFRIIRVRNSYAKAILGLDDDFEMYEPNG